MQNLQRTARAFLGSIAILGAHSASAATCPASNEPQLLACAMAAFAGDTIVVSAPFVLTGTPLVVPVDVTLTGATLSGVLAKEGGGTLTLDAAHTFDPVDVRAGSLSLVPGLVFAATNLQGAGGISVGAGATLLLAGGPTTFDGVIDGAGGIEIPGGANVTFTANHTYNGNTRVAGTVNLGTGGTSGALGPTGPIEILGNFIAGAIVNVNRSNVYDMPNPLATGGRLFMSGPGELRLSGPSTRTSGQTTVRGGGQVTIANPLATAGGGAVINQFQIEDGRLHFAASVSDVRLRFANANARLTVAAGVTVNPLSMGIGAMADRYLIGDPANSGTFAIDLPLAGFNSFTNFSTAFRVEGGTVRFGNTFFNGATDTFGSTYVAAGATIEVNASPGTVNLRNLQGDGRVIVSTATNLRGPTNFNGRIEGAGTLTLTEPTILTGDNSGYSGSLNVNAPLNVGAGGPTGTLGTGLVFVNNVLTVDRAGTLTMPNVFQSSGTIVKNGAGTLTLSGASPYNGPVNVQVGTLAVTGSNAATVTNNARFMGTGSVGAVNNPSGVLAPGLSPGILTVGNLNLTGGSLEVEINGPTAGSGYDQLNVGGAATLGGALNVLMGFVPTVGNSFLIVNKTSPGAIAGTFAGLPEGATFNAGASMFRISYVAGDGNDVQLTTVALPTVPLGASVAAGRNEVTVMFSPPANAGGYPILDYTVTCGGVSVVTPGSPVVVSGLAANVPVTCTVTARTVLGSSPATAPLPVTPLSNVITAASPTGTGSIMTGFSGGGGTCAFTPGSSFIPLTGAPKSPPTGSAPAEVTFPQGLFDFSTTGCTPGSTITITLIYPTPPAAGMRAGYYKYGRTLANPVPHWYELPSTVSGNAITFSITDGGAGDDDLVANGSMVDPGGIGLTPLALVPKPGAAYQALWWADPPGSENGWGINTTHQGNTIFATWFTYDASGEPMWLVMPNAQYAGDGIYSGPIYRTTGPAFNAVPFDPMQVRVTPVGDGMFTFTGPTAGTFAYLVEGVSQVKRIVRQEYASPVPVCTIEGAPNGNVNYQDLWWGTGGAESGWGVNIVHQGDTLFVTWFTYDAGGKGTWLVMSDVRRTSGDTFAGKIYRTRGNRFDSVPWNTKSISVSEAGTATFTFSDRNRGTFAYTLDGVSQSKPIARQVFGTPPALCQ